MKAYSVINTIATIALILIFIVLLAIFIVGISNQTTQEVTVSQVDSIKYENKKLTIEVEQLDSIKNVEIIEVKSLNNDSTLKLFYELIRE